MEPTLTSKIALIEILTERLSMRPPTLDDAENVFARYAHDAEVCRYLSWRPHCSVADTLDYLRQIVSGIDQGARMQYLIFERDSTRLLGAIGGILEGPRVQFGYVLARDAWGHGFATEAARAFVERTILLPNVWRIQAFCDLENKASARVLTKAGLKLEGTLRRYMIMPNRSDAPRDVYCFAKVRDRDSS